MTMAISRRFPQTARNKITHWRLLSGFCYFEQAHEIMKGVWRTSCYNQYSWECGWLNDATESIHDLTVLVLFLIYRVCWCCWCIKITMLGRDKLRMQIILRDASMSRLKIKICSLLAMPPPALWCHIKSDQRPSPEGAGEYITVACEGVLTEVLLKNPENLLRRCRHGEMHRRVSTYRLCRISTLRSELISEERSCATFGERAESLQQEHIVI